VCPPTRLRARLLADRLAIGLLEEIIAGAAPNIFTYYCSYTPSERYMIGAVGLFKCGGELCSNIVRGESTVEITACYRVVRGNYVWYCSQHFHILLILYTVRMIYDWYGGFV